MLSKNLTNLSQIEPVKVERDDHFGFIKKSLSQATGAEKLGCRYYEVAPGKRAWPYHYHYGNEEAIFILEGEGLLRQADGEHPVKKDDFMTFPVGPEHAHQLINNSSAPLKYLCFSTMIEPDVCVYPYSNKIGVFAVDAPGMPVTEKTLEKFYKNEELSYYEGE